MLTLLAVLIILSSLAPWSTSWQADWLAIKFVATWLWSKLVRLATAPLTDFRAMFDRAIFILGVLFLVISLLPGGGPIVKHGTYDDLRQAIIEYQQAHGLSPDGVWGPKTNTLYRKGA